LEAENPQPNPIPENASRPPLAAEYIPEVPLETPPPKKGVWPFWPTIGFGAAIFAVYFIAQSLVAIIFAIVFTIQKYANNPNLDPVQMIQSLASNGLLLSLATIISALAGCGAIILFVKIRKGPSIIEYLGLQSFNKKIILILVIIGGLLVAASTGLDRFFPQSQNANFTIDAYNTAIWPPLLGIAVVVFAPLFEEGFFRGFLFVGLRRSRLGAVWTVILTSAAWASLHLQYDLYGIASILVLGVVLGIVRLKTNSLWAVIILHALWNLAAIVGTALYVNGIGN
jgi:membrane protease YdiL (CAAX protease family)